MTNLDLDTIKRRMNQKITNLSLEEFQEITKELQPEGEYTKRIIHDLERGEYTC